MREPRRANKRLLFEMKEEADDHLGELGEQDDGGRVVGERAVGRLGGGDEDAEVHEEARVRAEDGKRAGGGEHCAKPAARHGLLMC